MDTRPGPNIVYNDAIVDRSNYFQNPTPTDMEKAIASDLVNPHTNKVLRNFLDNRDKCPTPFKWDSFQHVLDEMMRYKKLNQYWPTTPNPVNSREVYLDPIDLHIGSNVGRLRGSDGMIHGTNDEYKDQNQTKWGTNTLGALCEQAYCKNFNFYWEESIRSYKNADVGTMTQIKGRPRPEGELIVRDPDRDDHAGVLVTGTGPIFTIRGWMFIVNAKKRKEFIRDPNSMKPSYFIPQYLLRTDFVYNPKKEIS